MNKIEKEKYSKLFKKYLPHRQHIVDSENNILNIFNNNEKWDKELNQPHLWFLIINYEKENIKIFVDLGYGYIAMIKNDKLENIGNQFITSVDEKYIAFTAPYFSNKVKLYEIIEEKKIIKSNKRNFQKIKN